ncbi:MAG: glycine dehydrogenase (aminomethyl-transferring) [Candidatus Omnitrophica bacterium CG1_02_46_14]|nr:MAG: glycine dehydrogenase (aminomethyl-transferring) [Candidatus Omnitrophica bacterium CG1_02_46_14]
MGRLIFEKHSLNDASWLPELDLAEKDILKSIPQDLIRKKDPEFPSLSELDVVRHFTNLSRKNFSVDTNFYPLGSCTMKYNPKALDSIAASTAFSQIHPYQSEDDVQGALKVLYETQAFLSTITGMDEFTLQPAAGAHGEFCGMLMVSAYHRFYKQKKIKVLVPDSSHGTNPASAALCGYEVVQVKSNAKGLVDVEDLKSKLDSSVACLMMTNPNTLGLFEEEILEISKCVHDAGGLLYYDGANMNALVGICRPGDMGFDIVHINLHKTFAVPHGTGGPGSGPVGVKKNLIPFLPKPRILKSGEKFYFEKEAPMSIGKLRTYYGNFGAIIRSYGYIKALGLEGLKGVSYNAILNANYLKVKLKDIFDMSHGGYCMHEFVMSGSKQKKAGVKTLDIAKRLLDFGVHAPTIYFPMIVEEAMMIEPTETESKETLDEFVKILFKINEEIKSNPEKVLNAPHTTPVSRIDEVLAARQLNLRYRSTAIKC